MTVIGSRRRGRPMLCSPDLLARVVVWDREGMSGTQISRLLNEQGIGTPETGSSWRRCHVWRLLRTAAATDVRDGLDRAGTDTVTPA
ncbi:hypothetical protein [Nocardia abscessus]|uniref:hypothetical protein n=1 Tax=Nocardia abscessus TaxID=120957 RepID=UPI0024543E4F|nr:hypothetical protein [Nocardia abscessus]